MKKKLAVSAAIAATLLLSSVNSVLAVPHEPAKIKSVEFIGMDVPKTPEQKNEMMYSTASAMVTYNDDSTNTFPLHYETLFKPGDVINGKTTGVTTYANGEIVKKSDGTPYISSAADMNYLMKVPGLPEHTYYLVNHYEGVGQKENGAPNPASMQLNTVKMDPDTGKLTVIDHKPIDFSAVHGILRACAGFLTPWNTILASEEVNYDARAHEADPTKSVATLFAKNYYQDQSVIGNPYYYGHVPEVSVDANGSTTVIKHYSMGRMSFEVARVMPDDRTAIYGVDQGPGGFFMYIADKAQDFSAGTLYAAKWVQTGTDNGGSANLEWIKLGHATDAEIEQLADTKKFSDIFDVTDDAVKGQAEGYTAVKAQGSKIEWLKVKPGMEKAAAFLETHRYAAYLGATIEFSKQEGFTYNEKDNKGYLAISSQQGSMLKESNVPSDHIQLPEISAGTVYEVSFKKNRKTLGGEKIDSDFVPVSMSGLVVGEDLPAPDEEGNTANLDKMANPDNLGYSEKMRTLFIAEDSDMHKNNITWAYNVDTKKLSRLVSTPGGGEPTGLQALDNLDGFTYLMLSAQNPSYVGYLAGLPFMGEDKKTGKDK